MKRFWILLLCLLSGLSCHVCAGILGDVTDTGSGGGRMLIDSMSFEWKIGYEIDFMDSFFLFPAIFPSDTGKTFYATSSTEGFSEFTEYLTDGKNYIIEHDGYGTPESDRFIMHVPSYGPDFVGYKIDMISLKVNYLTLNSPGRNPNRDGIWTDRSFDLIYSFHGEPVPEPSSLILLGLGGLILKKKTKK